LTNEYNIIIAADGLFIDVLMFFFYTKLLTILL